jgi:hypothetical protein
MRKGKGVALNAPHEMTPIEREQLYAEGFENAQYLARMNRDLARLNPDKYTPTAEAWEREAERIKSF